jgi:hypothetical protein
MTSKMKSSTLSEMAILTHQIQGKLILLDALDRDTTQPDNYDLTDQIVTLEKTLKALRDVISRAHNIVPTT